MDTSLCMRLACRSQLSAFLFEKFHDDKFANSERIEVKKLNYANAATASHSPMNCILSWRFYHFISSYVMRKFPSYTSVKSCIFIRLRDHLTPLMSVLNLFRTDKGNGDCLEICFLMTLKSIALWHCLWHFSWDLICSSAFILF